MKKHILLQGVLLFVCYFLVLLPVSAQGYLHRNGQTIVDGQGKEVVLRGIGLGGWMLQEGYMLKTSGPQHQLEARITELVGEARKQEFYDAWLANHTRKIDIDSLAAWGYNSVRLPMHYKLYTPPIEEEPVAGQITWRAQGFEMTDRLLEWCKANNLYLILDLHAAPGGQGKNADISDYDPGKPSLWESTANQDKMVALWRKLAERYANEPMMGAYDIINEPNWGFQNLDSDPNGCAESQNTLLWDLQKRVTAAIREVDTNHLIFIEGNCWGNNYAGLPTLWDQNMALSYHKYWNSNDQNAIQNMLNMRQQRNVPIWLGETGENSNAWFTDAISLLESNKIGWAWWPLKKMHINNPLEVKTPAGYQKIVDYWSNPGSAPKPTAEEAYQALMQLADNLKLENNVYHKDVVDAKIRQPHTEETIPFKKHLISATAPSTVFAVDFDLGRHGVAYQDTDYTNTTGKAGGLVWNKGSAYRNDGVDIEVNQDQKTNGYNVGWTEAGEWMQYTLQVAEAGFYTVQMRTASTNANGKLSLRVNGVKVSPTVALPNTSGYQSWQSTQLQDVYLKQGANALQVYIETGGFNFNYMELSKQAAASKEQPSLLEGSIRHQEKALELVFNQPFTAFSAAEGFTVTVNGQAVPVEHVQLKVGEERVISLLLQAPVPFGSEVLVSYGGTSVTTATGVVLAAFADQPVQVLSDGQMIAIPARIQAEDFMLNQGFQTEPTSDTGGGLNIGYTDSGDYLEYRIFVGQEGIYTVNYRVATQSDARKFKLQLSNNGSWQDLDAQTFAATGGWQNWTTISGQASLTEGVHMLRLLAETGSFNLNWFEFTYLRPTGLGNADGIDSTLITLYPNPARGRFKIQFKPDGPRPQEVIIMDLTGKKVLFLKPGKGVNELQVQHSLQKGMYLVVFEVQGKRITKKLVVE